MASARKIQTLDQLMTLRAEAKRLGRTFVHCHGCFDIVHPGHIAYLQFAKSQGAVLLASLTADPQVNKGVDRPLVPQDLRAQSLAALECVDLVYINPDATAVGLLEAIEPDVYVKGREYETNTDPRFLAEREMVIRHGGRVIFSSGDVIYSSTALIGAMDGAALLNEEKVRQFRRRFGLDSAAMGGLFNRFKGKRVLVIGDAILDRYHFCDAASIAGEGPMMSLRHLGQEEFDGGAAVIALHLAAMGAEPVLHCAMGEDEASVRMEMRLRDRGVQTDCLRQRRAMVSKARYVADGVKLFKVDEGGPMPLDSRHEAELAGRILERCGQAEAVIFADFGYGTITAGLLERVGTSLRQKVGVMAADVSGTGSGLWHFRNMDLLCPTEREMRQAMNDFSGGINAVAWGLLSRTGARQAMITMGKQGLLAFDRHRPTGPGESWERHLRGEHLPSLCGRAIDPLGCGDALLAGATLTLAAGGSLHAAAYVGSLAASIEARMVGNRAVSLDQLMSRPAFEESPVRLAS